MFFDESPKDSKKFIGEMKTIKRSIRRILNNYYNGELNIDLPYTPDNLQKVDIYEKVLEDFHGIMDKLEYLELPTKEIGKLTFDEKLNSWYCGESKIKENQSFEVLLKPTMDPNPYWVQTALKYNSEEDLWYLENLTVYGENEISGLRTRIRGWDAIDKSSDQVLSLKSFVKPKRMTTSRVGRAMSKKMEDKFWEIYDLGYEQGDKSEKQKIEAIRKEDYTLFRMSQQDPYRVRVFRDPRLYEFEGAVWIQDISLAGLDPVELITLWGQDFFGKPIEEEW
ncbi:hypothetical protein [Enterococcus casseliflavus]